MSFDFDRSIDRRGSSSAKWELYPEDVLPMWVADMDFRSPEPLIQALQERALHGSFGYTKPPQRLKELICARMDRLYGWQITPDDIMVLPGLVVAINVLCRALGEPGDRVLTPSPAYPPFLSAPPNQQRLCDTVELTATTQGATISYELDLDRLRAACTPQTRLFLLSHPHNPIGLQYSPAQLAQIGAICAEHDAIICSDEIHCELPLGDTQHVPFAVAAPEFADRCVTLIAPSKTFNLPGLGCGFAIVTNPALRSLIQKTAAGIVPHVNAFGIAGSMVAFEQCDDWLHALRAYLTANRDAYVAYIAEHLPQLRTTVPQATYLGWIDCREAGIEGDPYTFFLEKAKVALSNGASFGPGGEGFVRFNFGCPRAQMIAALDRMRDALQRENLSPA
ncbi:MAG: putative C-S lyase [Oscillochloris sp.]|nr:putative C-S lyase [Oscillochloris sp.]